MTQLLKSQGAGWLYLLSNGSLKDSNICVIRAGICLERGGEEKGREGGTRRAGERERRDLE